MAMTWRPPEDLAEQLRVIAFHTRRSVNDMLIEAARDWVEAKGRKAAQDAQQQKRATK